MTRPVDISQWRDRTEEPVIVWAYTGVWELMPVAVDAARVCPQPVGDTYEIREIDAYLYDDTWTWNTSYHLGTFTTTGDPVRAFRRALARMGITFYRGKTRTEYDGDVYEIVDRATGQPLFAAIPQEV